MPRFPLGARDPPITPVVSRKRQKQILLLVAVGGPLTIALVTAAALLALTCQAKAIGLAALPCIIAVMLTVGAWVGEQPRSG